MTLPGPKHFNVTIVQFFFVKSSPTLINFKFLPLQITQKFDHFFPSINTVNNCNTILSKNM